MWQRRRCFIGAVLAVAAMIALGAPSAARADHTWTYTSASVAVVVPAPPTEPPTQGLFTFTPPVATGMPQYDWQYEISEVYLRFADDPTWQPWGLTQSGGPDSASGLPFSLGQDVTIHELSAGHENELIIECTIKQSVDADGAGHFDITGITWGWLWLGTIRYDVTGIAAVGWVDVVPVPEPAGILMLLSGAGMLGLVALWRRRR